MAGTRSGSPIVETLILFAIVFVLQFAAVVVGAVGLMAGLFVLSPPLATNPWTIVTSVYAHNPANVWHLVSNSVALVVFGWPVARATTRLRFHTFFVVTGALAGVAQILVTGYLAAAPLVSVTATDGVLGASGAVFALMGYLLASNRLSTSVAGVVEVPRWLTIVVFVGLAAAVTIATGAPGVALIAHFTGFLLGLAAGRAGVLRPRSGASARRWAA